MNDQSQMMMNLNQMSQPQMMNQVQMMSQSQPQLLTHNQAMNQQPQPQMKPSQIMMNQTQPPMMNRGGYKVWSQQPPLDPNMKFQNPMKPNYAASKPGRSNWKGKKVTDKRKDPRRMEKPNPNTSLTVPNNSVGYQPPTLHELQSQNRLKARKFYPKKKFNNRFAPYAPRNTTSFIIRAKKSGGIASLVSPCPVTPAVLPTPILSPSREVLGDMAKEEWGVDGYGSMKGLIRLRSPGHEADVHDDEDEEDGGGGSSESDVEEHVEVERRLDHDLSRFEMIYPNYGVEYNNVLENRVDDQDSHIAQLEEENLTLKERLFLMERELGDLRRRLLFLERQNQVVEDVNEEVVENGSDNESEGGSDVPVMGIENNAGMVDSMLESGRNGNFEVNAKLDNDGVSEAEGVVDVCMEESVPDEAITKKNEIKGNEMRDEFVFNEVKGVKDEQKDEEATQQSLPDKVIAKENDVMDKKETGEFEVLDRNDSMLESGRNGNFEVNAKLDNDGVSEAEGVVDVCMEVSVPDEAIANNNEIKGNEMRDEFVFNEVKEVKDEQKDEEATQQSLPDKVIAKENDVMDKKETGEFEVLDRNDESKVHEATNECVNDVVFTEKYECKNQAVGTSSETVGDDDLSVPR